MQPFNLSAEQVENLMAAVLMDEVLDTRARDMCDQLELTYSQNHDRTPGTIRVSDAGGCVRAVWAEAHGKMTLPWLPPNKLAMANGTGMGAYMACVLKVGIMAYLPGYVVDLEVFFNELVPGHCDLLVSRPESIPLRDADAVFEFKWTKFASKEGCKPYYRDQSGKYAQYAAAPLHYVVLYVATAKTDNPLTCYRFESAETLFDVSAEYRRLQGALTDEMPNPDVKPGEEFRCSSCRFADCGLNNHPLREKRSTLELLVASVQQESSHA